MYESKRCENCNFFEMSSHVMMAVGYCHRYPPKKTNVEVIDGCQIYSPDWPIVRDFDMCGEWKKKD